MEVTISESPGHLVEKVGNFREGAGNELLATWEGGAGKRLSPEP